MFGMFQCLQMKQAASKAEKLEVTEDEFVQLAVASGRTEEKARETVSLNKAMNCHTLIGNQLLIIVDRKKRSLGSSMAERRVDVVDINSAG